MNFELRGTCVRCGDAPLTLMQCQRCQIYFCGVCFSPEIMINEFQALEKKNRCPGCQNEDLHYFHHSVFVSVN